MEKQNTVLNNAKGRSYLDFIKLFIGILIFIGIMVAIKLVLGAMGYI